jgi:hypothetical protein
MFHSNLMTIEYYNKQLSDTSNIYFLGINIDKNLSWLE